MGKAIDTGNAFQPAAFLIIERGTGHSQAQCNQRFVLQPEQSVIVSHGAKRAAYLHCRVSKLPGIELIPICSPMLRTVAFPVFNGDEQSILAAMRGK